MYPIAAPEAYPTLAPAVASIGPPTTAPTDPEVEPPIIAPRADAAASEVFTRIPYSGANISLKSVLCAAILS